VPGTAKLEEAVAAHRDALKEITRERAPLRWAMSFGSEGVALILSLVTSETGAGSSNEEPTPIGGCCSSLKRSFAPPALSERRHRRLARTLVVFLSASPADYASCRSSLVAGIDCVKDFT